jgi:hypothetical protein
MEKKELTLKELYWSQKKSKERSLELVNENKIIGSIKWKKVAGSRATAELDDQKWTFKRIGFFKPRVTIRSEKKEETIAIFEPKRSGDGSLFLKKKKFTWKPTDTTNNEFAFYNENDKEFIVKISKIKSKKTSEVFKFKSKVEINETVKTDNQLLLLIVLSCYLFESFENDSAIEAAKTGIIT